MAKHHTLAGIVGAVGSALIALAIAGEIAAAIAGPGIAIEAGRVRSFLSRYKVTDYAMRRLAQRGIDITEAEKAVRLGKPFYDKDYGNISYLYKLKDKLFIRVSREWPPDGAIKNAFIRRNAGDPGRYIPMF
jgi:hypothetical protein